jgi:hypothetical protein
MNNWISNQINWNNLKPKKTCLICNINEDYVCFECEDIFVKENYLIIFIMMIVNGNNKGGSMNIG